MIDTDTFLTTLYVRVDDFCKSERPVERPRPGPARSLTRSEVLTLVLFSQWHCFRNQRTFYRLAVRRLRPWFPHLPSREQFNRLMRTYYLDLVAFGNHLVQALGAERALYEILDTSGIPVRNVKRRGHGWLVGLANIGRCGRLGWFNGFQLLLAVTPEGVITGFGFGPGSTKEQPLTAVLLAARHADPAGQLPTAGPAAASGLYLADKGFAGETTHAGWRAEHHATVISEPQSHSTIVWPAEWQAWLRSHRQRIEAVFGALIEFFRLGQDRPHELLGFQTNLAAKLGLHNFCIWLNRQLGRNDLAFADLTEW